jgi:hypothetical protein
MSDTKSQQNRLAKTTDQVPFIWTIFESFGSDVPAWGEIPRSGDRILKCRAFAREEPILAGAIASMSSKLVSVDWQIVGGRNRVRRYHEMLAEAEDGAGWSWFIDRLAQDYLATDVGGVVELAREGQAGPVGAVYNIDAARVGLTGNANTPIRYRPWNGDKEIALGPADFFRVVDSPSPDEAMFGLGFCAVSRALKASRVLLALYKYESEQLADLPPKGFAAITGMTVDEVEEAFARFEARRDQKKQTTYKGTVFLASIASPMQPIDVKLVPFANLPDGFDKAQAIQTYVYTLALDFGVDVREFWPASQTGATKAEAEIQAAKAKGKGYGRMVSAVERAINWNALPDSLEFQFDLRDSEDDLFKANIRARLIENARRLWEPNQATGMGIVSTEEARRMLVEDDVVPEWLAQTEETTAYGSENAVDENSGAVVPESMPPTETAIDQAVTQMAEKARLRPGEDLVAINHTGDMVTIKSSTFYSIGRRPIAVSNWPRPEVEAAHPFWFPSNRAYP